MVITESDKYQVTIQETGHYNKSVLLFVRHLAEDDFGTYTCIGENQFGHDQEQMELVGKVDCSLSLSLSVCVCVTDNQI